MTAEKSSRPWKAILAQADRLFFPPVCLGCNGRVDSPAAVLCEDCRQRVLPIRKNYCDKCGSPLRDYACPACAETHFAFDTARSGYVYDDRVRRLVHQLKYYKFLSPAGWFADSLLALPAAVRFSRNYDFVMAVPLHRVRQRDRGFNQSGLIAKKLAAGLGLPYREPVIRRVNTPSQTNLSGESRRRNLEGAFALRKSADVSGKKIILVDDVFTTGSTVNEISLLLKAGGAARVFVLTPARAV